jgi:hypothetical protein
MSDEQNVEGDVVEGDKVVNQPAPTSTNPDKEPPPGLHDGPQEPRGGPSENPPGPRPDEGGIRHD